jgi:hypothetical protein
VATYFIVVKDTETRTLRIVSVKFGGTMPPCVLISDEAELAAMVA